MTRPIVYSLEGACYVVDEAGVRIRVTGPDDQTADEHNTYDPDCASCWLGHAHSGDYHRRMLATRKATAR